MAERRLLRPYTLNEIRYKVEQIAIRYKLKAVYLFGSYARGEATVESDIDFLIDTEGAGLDTLFKLGGLYAEIEEEFDCPIDMITVASLQQPTQYASQTELREQIWEGKVELYVAA